MIIYTLEKHDSIAEIHDSILEIHGSILEIYEKTTEKHMYQYKKFS